MHKRQATASPGGATPLLTVAEAAAALAVGKTALYELIRSGELPTVKVGRSRRVDPAAVREFVERNTKRGIR